MKRAQGAIGIAITLALLQGCAATPAEAAGREAEPRAVVVATAPAGDATALAVAPSAAPQGSAATTAAPDVGAHNTAGPDDVIANVGGRTVTMRQLMEPLVEAHGLPVLLNLVQLELAKQAADRAGITVTEDDVATERRQTTDRMFKETDDKVRDKIDEAIAKKQFDEADRLKKELQRDHEQLLEQFLQNQKVSRPEFELVLRTNVYLRKIAEPRVTGQITDEELRKAYETEYGASVRVRHIQGNPQELARAQARIAAGEKFEIVARQMSRNPQTAGLGGELPRFSLATAGLPENFKRAAFDLKVGEVSNMVEAEGSYHLIKLEEKFAPKAVKFESVKEGIRERLRERTVQLAVKRLRDSLAEQARKDLKIQDPTLRRQFDAKLAERDKQITEERAMREQFEKERAHELEEGKRLAPKPPAAAAPGGTPAQPAPDAAPASPEAAPAAPAAPAPAVAPADTRAAPVTNEPTTPAPGAAAPRPAAK